jgi:hypothetical protein
VRIAGVVVPVVVVREPEEVAAEEPEALMVVMVVD